MKKLIFFFIIVLFFNCSKNNEYWPTNGWKTASPESMGVSSEALIKMLKEIELREVCIDSILVIRNGYLVFDFYKYPYKRNRLHNIYSCTKSVISILTGIAVKQKYIKDENQKFFSFFNQTDIKVDPDKKQSITLKHALTMTTGIEFEDSYIYRWKNLNKMTASKNWTRYALNHPVKYKPGERFDYSNLTSFLLSAMIKNAAKMKVSQFAEKYLFGPLGIRKYLWTESPEGVNAGYSDLRINNHDLAKIGFLYLNDGCWVDKQVVTKEWVRKSTSPLVKAGTLQNFYGYQWWVEKEDVFMALGHAGQYLIVDRKNRLITVINSSLNGRKFYIPFSLYYKYILSPLSKDPLKENPQSLEKLRGLVKKMSLPHFADKQPVPGWIKKYLNKKFKLNKNIYDVNALKFTADKSGNDLFIHLYLDNEIVKLKVGLKGEYEISQVKEDEYGSVKGKFLNNKLFLNMHAPEFGWTCEYIIEPGKDHIKIVFTDIYDRSFERTGVF